VVVVCLRAESIVHGALFRDLVSCDIVTSFQEITPTPNYVKSIPAKSLKTRNLPDAAPQLHINRHCP
jgi:hypothetical protein